MVFRRCGCRGEYRIEQIRAADALQGGRHVRGKVVTDP
jgi:hypothetical protein